jgi:N-acetylmuramoyl-L-alanine amidase
MKQYPESNVPASSTGGKRKALPTVIVLHHTGGSGNDANEIAYLQNNPAGVSIHYYISKTGTRTRMVPDDVIAYHCGNSKVGSLGAPNAASLGIEICNTGSKTKPDPYPLAQIESTAQVVARWLHAYPIQMITSHAGIDTKGKYDPYNFPWQQFYAILATYMVTE